MDYFTNKKFMTWTIAILVLLNILTLSGIWFLKFSPKPPFADFPRKERSEFLLKKKLNLTDEQLQKFRDLRKKHFEETREFGNKIHNLKRELSEEVFKKTQNQSEVEKLIEKVGQLEMQIEKGKFKHFLELKSVCTPEQQKKFREIFKEIMPPHKVTHSHRREKKHRFRGRE
ncbi:MAG: hypothetical protein DWQ06_04840 [Calditrichaeota bacterium]|nr:MAG: hypothetical protein DWQ06_04840 [Calditrichota bacterium]